MTFRTLVINGKPEYIPVTIQEDKIMPLSSSSPLEILFMLSMQDFKYGIKDNYESPINFVLKHPHNFSIKEKDFLSFILENAKNTKKPRMCYLNAKSLVEVLHLIKKTIL